MHSPYDDSFHIFKINFSAQWRSIHQLPSVRYEYSWVHAWNSWLQSHDSAKARICVTIFSDFSVNNRNGDWRTWWTEPSEEHVVKRLGFVDFYSPFMRVISEILRTNRKPRSLRQNFMHFWDFLVCQRHTKTDNQSEMH